MVYTIILLKELNPLQIYNMCLRCLTVFDKKKDDCKCHTNTCNVQTTIEYAQPGERVGFQKVKSLYPHPLVAFLDFESFSKKLIY